MRDRPLPHLAQPARAQARVEERGMVAHRSSIRSVTVERPRQKGWWGEPDADDLEHEPLDLPSPPAREAARRPAAPRTPRPVTPVGRALTTGQVEAIRAVMRL